MRVCKICIQAGTYQELLIHWHKRRLRCITNHANLITEGPVEQLNAESIFSRYSDILLTNGEPIYPRAKDAAFYSMCDFPDKVFMCVKLLQ